MEPLRIVWSAVKRLTGYFILRPLQRYNIEERAFKKLEKQSEVIKPAPKHRSTQELLHQIQRDHPEILEDIKKEPEELMHRLTEVKVHSEGHNPVLKVDKSKLPEFTRLRQPKEPAVVTKGKVTMPIYCEMINSRRHNPFIYTSQYFAERYNLDIEHVEDLLDHFRGFQVYSPAEIPKSRVPWWAPQNIEEFLMPGFAPYHNSLVEMEEKANEEGRRRMDEARIKRLEEQKLEAAQWFAKQTKLTPGSDPDRKVIPGPRENLNHEKDEREMKNSENK